MQLGQRSENVLLHQSCTMSALQQLKVERDALEDLSVAVADLAEQLPNPVIRDQIATKLFDLRSGLQAIDLEHPRCPALLLSTAHALGDMVEALQGKI